MPFYLTTQGAAIWEGTNAINAENFWHELRWGTGTTALAPDARGIVTNTTLETPVANSVMTRIGFPETNVATGLTIEFASRTAQLSEAWTNYSEFGVFNSAGVMVAIRRDTSGFLTKLANSEKRYVVTWNVNITPGATPVFQVGTPQVASQTNTNVAGLMSEDRVTALISGAGLATSNNPVFTGDARVSGTLPPATDNDTTIATTAFVNRALVGLTVVPENLRVQKFTSGGTWTKPANCRSVAVSITSGGAGGNSGGAGVNISGGFAGGTETRFFQASELPATVGIGVGRGGRGQTDGTGNSQGGNSWFGDFRVEGAKALNASILGLGDYGGGDASIVGWRVTDDLVYLAYGGDFQSRFEGMGGSIGRFKDGDATITRNAIAGRGSHAGGSGTSSSVHGHNGTNAGNTGIKGGGGGAGYHGDETSIGGNGGFPGGGGGAGRKTGGNGGNGVVYVFSW